MYVRELFDPDEALRKSEPMIRVALPALEEALRFGLEAFTRCWNDAIEKEQDLFAFGPYHRLLEMLDGVAVIVAGGGTVAAVPGVRGMFDCLLAIEWITREDHERRSAAFAVGNVHRSIRLLRSLDPSTEQGKQARATMSRDRFAGHLLNNPHFRDQSAEVEALEQMLAEPRLREAEAEWQRLKVANDRTPSWHELFGGPRTREELAQRVGLGYVYEIMYRSWSGTSHGEDLHRLGRRVKGDEFPLRPLRDWPPLPSTSAFAVHVAVMATRAMLRAYRPGEQEASVERWYLERLAPAIHEIFRASAEPEESARK